MLYTIINPADHYTIDCQDLDVAVTACVLLGNGQYGLVPVDQLPHGINRGVPLFAFGNGDEWCIEHLGATLSVVLAQVLEHKRIALAEALDSVLIGDRSAFLSFAPAPDVPLFRDFRAKWHDERRTSMNDIGGRAYAMAAHLRAGELPIARAPQQVFVK